MARGRMGLPSHWFQRNQARSHPGDQHESHHNPRTQQWVLRHEVMPPLIMILLPGRSLPLWVVLDLPQCHQPEGCIHLHASVKVLRFNDSNTEAWAISDSSTQIAITNQSFDQVKARRDVDLKPNLQGEYAIHRDIDISRVIAGSKKNLTVLSAPHSDADDF